MSTTRGIYAGHNVAAGGAPHIALPRGYLSLARNAGYERWSFAKT